MHHVSEEGVGGLSKCDDVQALIRARVGSYNKTKLRREHYPEGSAVQAALRAERLDTSAQGGDIPQSAATRVYKLIRAIVSKSLPSQLPPELRS